MPSRSREAVWARASLALVALGICGAGIVLAFVAWHMLSATSSTDGAMFALGLATVGGLTQLCTLVIAGIALVRTVRVRAWGAVSVACVDVLLAIFALGFAASCGFMAAIAVSLAGGVPIH